MAKKYLLSTGKVTNKLEDYILDLIKINLIVLPNDIPGDSEIGFDYSLDHITKDLLYSELLTRVELLISKISKKVNNIPILINQLTLINELLLDLTVTVNLTSENFNINLYK